MKNNLFTKDEFFSSSKNLKISLLYKLFKNGKIQKYTQENEQKNTQENEKNDDYYGIIQNRLDEIRNELDGEIKKKQLEEFLNNDENFIKERLGLINLILEGFNSDDEYLKLKNKK